MTCCATLLGVKHSRPFIYSLFVHMVVFLSPSVSSIAVFFLAGGGRGHARVLSLLLSRLRPPTPPHPTRLHALHALSRPSIRQTARGLGRVFGLGSVLRTTPRSTRQHSRGATARAQAFLATFTPRGGNKIPQLPVESVFIFLVYSVASVFFPSHPVLGRGERREM